MEKLTFGLAKTMTRQSLWIAARRAQNVPKGSIVKVGGPSSSDMRAIDQGTERSDGCGQRRDCGTARLHLEIGHPAEGLDVAAPCQDMRIEDAWPDEVGDGGGKGQYRTGAQDETSRRPRWC